MYALVYFVDEKTEDGSTPCEVVRFSWLTDDQQFCFWPGGKNYKLFMKNGKGPLKDWTKCQVRVKFISGMLFPSSPSR